MEQFFTRKKAELGVSLNEVQKKAVLHTEGPLLLLASPGSGKTTTTIMRIGYLIEEKGVHPSRIKAVTFSRASAMDMKERFARFFPQYPKEMIDFSTIHSLAFSVVKEHFYQNGVSYQFLEGMKKKNLLREIYKDIVGEVMTDDQYEVLSTYISFIKNKMIPTDKWGTVRCDVPEAEQILRKYEHKKAAQYGVLFIDYDDMLTIAHEAFIQDQQLLQSYQNKYEYFLTDESQDTSLIQHKIIEKLVEPHQNLYVVADDDQSIYSWRGAEPEYLIRFKEKYPNAVILKMEQNYRSSKDIVEVANRFIKRNKERYDKNMFTENPAHKPIKVLTLEDYCFQANYIVKKITKSYRDYAVLYRNNSSSIMLVNEFERAGIPFYMKDADNRFFSHWVVKDILNFMRMSFNARRVDIFEQIRSKCNFFITKEQMSYLYRTENNKSILDRLLQRTDLKDYQVRQIKNAKEVFRSMKGKRPLHVIQMIRNDLGYEQTIKDISKKFGFKHDALLSILQTLEEIADPLPTMEEFAYRLKHLEAVMNKAKGMKNENAVTLSTFHSSKGLEFKKVFMVDLIEGVIPGNDEIKEYQDGNPKPIEEAVRLFYVGMTRAEQELELLTYNKHYGKNVRPSQFVSNVKKILDPNQPIQQPKATEKVANRTRIPTNPNAIRSEEQLHINSIVIHRVFGHGKILTVDADKIHIQFQKETKQLSTKTCLEMGLLEPKK